MSLRSKRVRDFGEVKIAPWMLTFMDMMTLVLTFFIVLVSMSVIDEYSRVRVVESVRSVFGLDDKLFNYDAPHDAKGIGSWAISDRPEDRLQESRQLVFADNQHISLRHTESSSILEVSGDMLFEPGGAVISEAGRMALDRLVPFLLDAQYPATVAGHSAPGIGEGAGTSLSAERLADSSWGLSMSRSLAVYRHFIERGVDKSALKMESFGAYRPEYDNNSADGRRRNRRVDIILDKRSAAVSSGLLRQSSGSDGGYIFRDFHFDLELSPPGGFLPNLPAPGTGSGNLLPPANDGAGRSPRGGGI